MKPIALYRLCQQGITDNRFARAEDIVAWLGAVQAQDYAGAKWSLGLRMRQASEETVEKAFNDGVILRTHVMRPTWHFVLPADIRWMLSLTAPRVNARAGFRYRQLELDDVLFARSNKAIVEALEGGKPLTRSELGAALAKAGITASGQRLGYIIFRAELDALICSGPRNGKQFTYALMEERAPKADLLTREEGLAELTRRYFTSHGPATIRDFVWWSGMTVTDAKDGLALAGRELIQENINGETFWFSRELPEDAKPSKKAFLLPTFDEYMVGYEGYGKSRMGDQDAGVNLAMDGTLVYQGKVAGSWRRTIKKGAVVFEIKPFAEIGTTGEEAVRDAAQRYGEFHNKPVEFA